MTQIGVRSTGSPRQACRNVLLIGRMHSRSVGARLLTIGRLSFRMARAMPNVFLYGPDAFRARVFDRMGTCDVVGAATLDGWALSFDKPNIKQGAAEGHVLVLGEGEGLANLVEAEGEQVYGMVFELSRAQRGSIEGYYGGYRPMDVQVVLKKDGKQLAATTFVSRRRNPKALPSPATLELSVQGAEENAFPRDYVEKLRGWQTYDG